MCWAKFRQSALSASTQEPPGQSISDWITWRLTACGDHSAILASPVWQTAYDHVNHQALPIQVADPIQIFGTFTLILEPLYSVDRRSKDACSFMYSSCIVHVCFMHCFPDRELESQLTVKCSLVQQCSTQLMFELILATKFISYSSAFAFFENVR